MVFLGKLLVAGVAGLVLKGLSDDRKAREEEERRKNTPCRFDGAVSRDDFSYIASQAVKRLKKKKIIINTKGAVVYGTVESQTGLSTWDFTVDFNDYGKITGKYWLWSENQDSVIPQRVAEFMQESIQELRQR